MWDDATRDGDVPEDEAWAVRRAERSGEDPARLLGEPTVALLARLPLVDRLLLEDRLTWLVERADIGTGPDHTSPEHTGPEHTGPEHTGPEHTGPDRPAVPRARLQTPLLPRSVRDPGQLVALVSGLPPEVRPAAVAACLEVLAEPRLRGLNPYHPARARLSRRRLVAVLPTVLGTAGIASLLGVSPPRLSLAALTAVPLVTAGATVIIAAGRRPPSEGGAVPAPTRRDRRWRRSPG